ncbi:MFS transporter [Aquabacter spiritensis]|uniref:Putative MFS family arabinose efflux permease n=1 Tax=Aquabacter spiritensis TaxID=933073 RepID=A0A4R3M4N4_9HYPH|nr:MFS transporter [Aquabacter spiritensis]TCT07992.1 putative MFS family arabinose efflux permease [Aquabacter spiritensis]
MIGLRAGISVAIAVILCAALAVIGWRALVAVERTIVPAISAQADSVGRSAAALVENAVGAGVPMNRLVGVDAYFADLLRANAELAEIRLVTPDGTVLGQAGALPAAADPPRVVTSVTARSGIPLASLVITVDPSVVSSQVAAVLVDVAFIGVVSLLVALELVALVVGARGVETLAALEARVRALARGRLWMHADAVEPTPLTAPIDAHVARLHARHETARALAAQRGDTAALGTLDALGARTGIGIVHPGENHAATVIRPALFLFMMAEELARPFLPRLAAEVAPPDLGIGADLAISLPIVIFMAGVALFQLPFAAASERLGRRRGFLIGAALAAASYVGSALTADYSLFLASRFTAAIGYALVFVSAQGHVIDHSRPSERTAGLAVFVRAILVAGLCGPPIGGVLADRLGDHNAFLASAAVAVLALLVAGLSLPPSEPRHGARGVRLSDLGAALRAPRLAALLFGCALPAKVLLVAICFYLVPVELQRQGYSAAAVGRLQMIYPVLMVLAVPAFAALAERHDARAGFVVGGSVIAGLGTLLLLAGTSPWIIAGVLALLGLGQAMSIAAQSALVADSARHVPGGGSAGVLGLFRLIERTGNAAGPAAAGVMLAALGFAASGATIGILVVAGALGFALSGSRKSATPRIVRPDGGTASEGSPL